MLHFDSDYMEGCHPQVMKRLAETNLQQTSGYGSDPHSEAARQLIRQACKAYDAEVYLLVGGTQTNSTVIDGLIRQCEGVMAAESAHINVHESGAIESCGHKVLTLPHTDGKLQADDVANFIADFYKDDTWPHMVSPGMLYITHPTEFGTLYSLEELTQLSRVCHEAGIPLYLDGARMGYGLSSPATDVTLMDIARLCDVFYIGATKCGALFGEAVVAKPGRLHRFFSLMKQHGAVMAKGRLLGIQFETLFTDGLYCRICGHAVSLALKLRDGFSEAGLKAVIDSPTNQQFFVMSNDLIDHLMQHATFEYWGPRGAAESMVRFVTSWATRDDDVDRLIHLVKTYCASR